MYSTAEAKLYCKSDHGIGEHDDKTASLDNQVSEALLGGDTFTGFGAGNAS